MKILGLHNGHDSGVTAMENGKIIYHWELERYLFGDKHFNGFHNKNIIVEFLRTVVMPTLGWRSKDLSAICLSGLYCEWDKYNKKYMPNMWSKTEFNKIIGKNKYKNDLKKPYVFWKDDWDNSEIVFFASTHHINHMAYSYYTSPFDQSLIFAYDGCGDFSTTTTVGIGSKNKIEYFSNFTHNKVYGLENNHIGYSYSDIGQVLGFIGLDVMASAGKAMGLASYGKSRREWKDLIRHSIINHKLRFVGEKLKIPKDIDSRSEMAKDFMATVQEVSEEYVLDVLGVLMKNINHCNICIGGGCGLNVQINSKVRKELTNNIYIPPACSDVGQSIGSCLYYWHNFLDKPFFPVDWHNPYLGCNINNLEFIDNYKKHFPRIGFRKFEDEKEMLDEVSNLLVNNKIIGWAQGRSEIGPRSLGNRSILASPCSFKMKDQINFKVKKREWWRPFAPVCIAEEAADWFDVNCDHPYMLESPNVRPEKSHLIPAVVHIDNTSRLQTVRKNQNNLLYNLLEFFHKKSKVPILLNTSLNEKGKPIANNVISILKLLNETQLDYAVINNFLFYKIKNYL